MKKLVLLSVLALMLGGGFWTQAQRPVGDTIMGREPTYMYSNWLPDTLPSNVSVYVCAGAYGKDIINTIFWEHVGNIFCNRTTTYQSPEWYTARRHHQYNSCNHIEGREFYPVEPVKVIGAAACGLMETDPAIVPWHSHGTYGLTGNVEDTTITGRATEYLQVYGFDYVEGKEDPVLQAQGPWRPEWPHRNINMASATLPIYEVLFDSAMIFDNAFVVAGTCSNNNLWDRDYLSVLLPESAPIYPPVLPITQWYNYPTVYRALNAICQDAKVTYYGSPTRYWWKPDTTGLGWYWIDTAGYYLCMFPILDTTYIPPCPVVTGLHSVGATDTTVTLMWNTTSSRQTSWVVNYGTSTVGWDTTFTTTVPTVMLTGLMPGASYWARVRGFCDTMPAPWSSNLQFVQPESEDDPGDDTIAPCPEVTELRCGDATDTTATLMWNTTSSRQTSWEVNYGTGGWDTTVTTTVPTVMLTDLTPGASYWARVRAFCDTLPASWSSYLQFTQPGSGTPGDDTTSIVGPSNLDQFTYMMPNPATGNVTVASSYGLRRVAAYDMTGRMVFDTPTSDLATIIDVSSWTPGVYVIAIHTPQGIATKRLVVR